MQSLKMQSHIYGNEARLLGKSSRVQQVIKAEAGCRSLPLKSLCGIHTEISKKKKEKKCCLWELAACNYKCPGVLSEQQIYRTAGVFFHAAGMLLRRTITARAAHQSLNKWTLWEPETLSSPGCFNLCNL